MNLKFTAIVVCILIVLGTFAGCTLPFGQEEQPSGGEMESVDATKLADADGKISYTKLFAESNTAALPLMKTDFDGVYYTMDTAGTVQFFRILDGVLTRVPKDGIYSVNVRCSGQNIPADIYYLYVDGKVNGFGLYTATNASGVLLYDYAFFKICELPLSFADDGELLLLIDTDKTRFYKDKIYSEQFYFDTDDLSTDYFLSEAQRQIGMDGIKMKDYKMFTDEILHQPYNSVYFFTSRAYVADSNKLVDIYTSGGYDTNIDNIRVVRNMLGMTFQRTENGIYYYSEEENGFVIYFYDGSNYTVEHAFTGDFETDYLRSGSAILEKNSGKVYEMLTKQEYTFDYSNLGTAFSVTDFVMNGSYAAIIGESLSGGIQVCVLDTQDGTVTVFDDFNNKNMESLHITNDGHLIISVCYESNYTAYQLICNLTRF